MPSKLSKPPIPLLPGDVLLYWSGSWYCWIIAAKTWHKVSHVETYVGDGKSIASRDGIGVGTYPLRLDGLKYVLRPTWNWDLQNVLLWHKTHEGEPYDWRTLLGFIGFREPNDRGMICSEHACWAALASGGRPFGNEPCGVIAPFQFLTTPAYQTVWSA